LDQFRVVNDAAGHKGGDELLRQVTHLLKDALSLDDTAARLAGDQFMVLRLMCSPEEAQAFAEGLRNRLNAFRFVTQGKRFFVGASCGVVPFETTAVDNVTTLIEAAEFACDAAKNSGRNKVCLLGLDSREVTTRHSETRWITQIQEALDEDRFELFQQPIVPTNPNRDRGHHYEILLRLRTEDGSIVPPDAFMPAAERFGMVRKLDEWVVKTTLAWLRANPRHSNDLFLVSINLSGRSLGSEEYLATLVEALEGAPHEKLCFEVTETGAIGNLAHAVEFIAKVRSLGCSFALDDFGSGLSSFGYLRQLPVDYLKIDGNLIKNIAVDEQEFAMVRSIAEVARTLGKQTVAEFVEDQAILDKLIELGIDFAQGYHLGRPLPLSNLADVPASVPDVVNVRQQPVGLSSR
ncbi:MAG: Amt family ammonium transporter, partial [Gammaproteobacteria bacterium]